MTMLRTLYRWTESARSSLRDERADEVWFCGLHVLPIVLQAGGISNGSEKPAQRLWSSRSVEPYFVFRHLTVTERLCLRGLSVSGGPVVDHCYNPTCKRALRYLRDGRVVRIVHGKGKDSRVEHYWLCGACSESYEFVFSPEGTVMLEPRVRQRSEPALHSST